MTAAVPVAAAPVAIHRVLLTGLLAGVFGGLAGLGGGVIMVPLLMAACALSRHQAHATSLAAIIATGLVGAATYAHDGNVDWLGAAVIAGGALLATYAGAKVAHRTDAGRLRRVFGVLLLITAILLLARPWLRGEATAELVRTPFSWAALAATGAAAGFLAGLLGVGGGSLMVPGMVLLAGYGQHLAQGTSLAAMVPAAVIGTWTHARAGTVAGRLLPGLVLGLALGTALGAFAARFLPDAWLRGIFAAVLLWMAWKDLRPRKA